MRALQAALGGFAIGVFGWSAGVPGCRRPGVWRGATDRGGGADETFHCTNGGVVRSSFVAGLCQRSAAGGRCDAGDGAGGLVVFLVTSWRKEKSAGRIGCCIS